jgi:hypothetical protein
MVVVNFDDSDKIQGGLQSGGVEMRTIVVIWLVCFLAAGLSAEPKTAEVVVTAVDGFGTRLTNTTVDSFVDEHGHDWVKMFPRDRGAGIPFGKYRISVQANGDFQEAAFDIEVNSPHVMVTACLEYIGIENTRPIGLFSGQLAGVPVDLHFDWCKASGLYSRMQYESPVSPTLEFDFGGIPPGMYILSCVGDKRVTLIRTVSVDAGSKPLRVEFQTSDSN